MARRAAEPTSLLGGRVRLGGEVSGTLAPKDDGYFNYSDYETSSLRLFRLDLAAEVRLASFASVLVDVRSDNLHAPRVYALYLRVRPWAERELDLQAGIVPPVFGAFPRRRYASDNPLPSRAPRLPVPDRPARGRGAVRRRRSSWPSAAAAGWCATRSARAEPSPGCRS